MGGKTKSSSIDPLSDEYWKINYSEPETMDGIFNAQEHALYVKSFFSIESVQVSSIIDLGFGKGHMLLELVKAFRPYKVMGLEPNKTQFKEFKSKVKLKDSKLKLENKTIQEWCRKSVQGWNRFDLGVCTSVLQYVPDKDIDKVLKILSEQVRYLYFSVPTNKELDRQDKEFDFKDPYALRRSKTWYYKRISSYFTFISARVLESKHFFDEKNTPFTDLLFRF